MKKVAVVAVVALLGVATAFGAQTGVSFYNDGGDSAANASLLPTNDGAATFIAIQNMNGTASEGTVNYFDNDGTARTPAVNTFSISAGSALSFRPVADDVGAEGAGAAVPNKNGGKVAGTAVILLPGAASTYAGRVAVHDDDYSYSFTLLFN